MTPSPPSFHSHRLARPSVLRTKQSWSSIPWLAAISCPRSGCRATTGAGSSRSPAAKSNWRKIIIRLRSSSSRPRSPAEASGGIISDCPASAPPRGKKAWSIATKTPGPCLLSVLFFSNFVSRQLSQEAAFIALDLGIFSAFLANSIGSLKTLEVRTFRNRSRRLSRSPSRCYSRCMADPTISPPEAVPSPVLDHSRRQLEALLDVSEIIAQHRDLKTLFHELALRLHSVVDSDFLTLVLHDPAKNVMRLHVLETRLETDKPLGMEHPVDGSPSGWVWQTQQPFIVEDVLTETRFRDFLTKLRDEGVRSFAALPLTTAQRRLGSMGFGRLRPQAISD